MRQRNPDLEEVKDSKLWVYEEKSYKQRDRRTQEMLKGRHMVKLRRKGIKEWTNEAISPYSATAVPRATKTASPFRKRIPVRAHATIAIASPVQTLRECAKRSMRTKH